MCQRERGASVGAHYTCRTDNIAINPVAINLLDSSIGYDTYRASSMFLQKATACKLFLWKFCYHQSNARIRVVPTPRNQLELLVSNIKQPSSIQGCFFVDNFLVQ
jgi:hypothetical protein